ncbi:hypothetical protein BJ741DRAFT_311537 [Chytriomyces cf. hyalinus JEL632]|nr:hypothetical protein BJ741DRAFT_311537 [Chytriomyces cf. hyalinus JEL632]
MAFMNQSALPDDASSANNQDANGAHGMRRHGAKRRQYEEDEYADHYGSAMNGNSSRSTARGDIGWTTMDELNSCVKKIELPLDCAREDLKNFLGCPLFDRKMNCLGKSKSVADTRVLLPWTDDLEMEDLLIQYVPDTWPQLTWSNSLLSALELLSSVSLPSASTLMLMTDSLQIEVTKAGFQQVLLFRP